MKAVVCALLLVLAVAATAQYVSPYGYGHVVSPNVYTPGVYSAGAYNPGVYRSYAYSGYKPYGSYYSPVYTGLYGGVKYV